MASTVSTVRLKARISANLHALLKRAAEVQGRTVTDFVVSAAVAAAHRAIEQIDVTNLTRRDQEVFAQAMPAPGKAD